MKPFRTVLKAVLTLAIIAGGVTSTYATTLRVGYWSSGISLGFGAGLEAQKFFEKQGLQGQFVHFPDVNGPTTALASNALDPPVGPSRAGAFSLSRLAVPL